MGKITLRAMSDSEVRQKLEEVIQHIATSEDEKKRHCQYYIGGEKHCKATTNKSCKHCDLFCPTIQSKIRIAVEYVVNTEKKLNEANIRLNLKNSKIHRLEDKIEKLRGQMEALHEELEKLEHTQEE